VVLHEALSLALSRLEPIAATVRLVPFEGLEARALYEILRLRAEVFVVEQRSIYVDPDGRDLDALHLSLERDGGLVAYARIFLPDTANGEARFGRVIVAPSVRGQHLGEAVVAIALELLAVLAPRAPVAIAAQAYLVGWYGRFGFVARSAEYLEDDIPHVDMIRESLRAY
jgi:ElaA protein